MEQEDKRREERDKRRAERDKKRDEKKAQRREERDKRRAERVSKNWILKSEIYKYEKLYVWKRIRRWWNWEFIEIS